MRKCQERSDASNGLGGTLGRKEGKRKGKKREKRRKIVRDPPPVFAVDSTSHHVTMLTSPENNKEGKKEGSFTGPSWGFFLILESSRPNIDQSDFTQRQVLFVTLTNRINSRMGFWLNQPVLLAG